MQKLLTFFSAKILAYILYLMIKVLQMGQEIIQMILKKLAEEIKH